MGASISDANRYAELFKCSLADRYGVTDVLNGEYDESGKLRVKCYLKREPLSMAVISRHLGGETSVGMSPLCPDGNCYWAAIDIDKYDRRLNTIIEAIYDFDIPLCPFYSKSKKLHLYAFFTVGIQPASARKYLKSYLPMFDLPNNIEIFPAQKSLTSTESPSWINLPYFGETRGMIKRDMTEYDIGEALDIITAKRKLLKEHEAFLSVMPYQDAPPCIQCGCVLRDVARGGRNNFLFSAGVYFRMKNEGADLDTLLTDVNNSLRDPIDDTRLRDTVLKGLQKKSYFYLCDKLCGCKEEECQNREFGKGSAVSPGIEFGTLERHEEDPPYYVWHVSGKEMTFYSEAEMISQTKFRELCLRYLSIVPRRVKDDRWVKIINRASENIVVVKPADKAGSFSVGSQFRTFTHEFFNTRKMGDNKVHVAYGRNYYDKEKDAILFSAKVFIAYMRDVKGFKYYKEIEMQKKLTEMGATKEGDFWSMPRSRIPEPEVKPNIDEIDFHDKDDLREEY